MRRKLASILVCIALAAGTALGAVPTWEEIESAPSAQSAATENIDGQTQEVEISVRNGYIYLTTLRPVQVKVYSVLGQLITQSTLPAGTHRLRLTTRGIYLLRAGNTTQRITI